MSRSRTHQRELADYAAEHGWGMSKTKSNHLQFEREGCTTVFASSSPSCPFAARKVKAQLERSSKGLPV